MKYHCDWCGCTPQECECEERGDAHLDYNEKAGRVLLDALVLRGERLLPRFETVRRTGTLRGRAC